jgi:hypothetical protein
MYASYPTVSLRYLDFHCEAGAYPHYYREFNVFDEEIQLKYFLGAILSVAMDPTHFLIPEDILEPSHLYLIGVPPSVALPWIQNLQAENFFDSDGLSDEAMDPLTALLNSQLPTELSLEEFLGSLDLQSPPSLQIGKLYLQSVLRQHDSLVVGMGPVGLNYSSQQQQQETLEGLSEDEFQRIRWLQLTVLYLQICVLCDWMKSSREGYHSSGSDLNQNSPLLLPTPPSLSRRRHEEGKAKEGERKEGSEYESGKDEDEEEETELPTDDPLSVTYASAHGSSTSSGNKAASHGHRYVLLSLIGPSSFICRDLVSLLSALDSRSSLSSSSSSSLCVPYLLIQLSSCSLTHRTIQFLLSAQCSWSSRIFFTVDGRVTHSKQKLLRELIFDIPLDKLVLESNGPLFPTISPPSYSDYPLPPLPAEELSTIPSTAGGGGSGRYHPGHLLIIAATIGAIKRMEGEVDAVLEVLWRNTSQILGL